MTTSEQGRPGHGASDLRAPAGGDGPRGTAPDTPVRAQAFTHCRSSRSHSPVDALPLSRWSPQPDIREGAGPSVSLQSRSWAASSEGGR